MVRSITTLYISLSLPDLPCTRCLYLCRRLSHPSASAALSLSLSLSLSPPPPPPFDPLFCPVPSLLSDHSTIKTVLRPLRLCPLLSAEAQTRSRDLRGHLVSRPLEPHERHPRIRSGLPAEDGAQDLFGSFRAVCATGYRCQ